MVVDVGVDVVVGVVDDVGAEVVRGTDDADGIGVM
jgi:hypothetical protein